MPVPDSSKSANLIARDVIGVDLDHELVRGRLVRDPGAELIHPGGTEGASIDVVRGEEGVSSHQQSAEARGGVVGSDDFFFGFRLAWLFGPVAHIDLQGLIAAENLDDRPRKGPQVNWGNSEFFISNYSVPPRRILVERAPLDQ